MPICLLCDGATWLPALICRPTELWRTPTFRHGRGTTLQVRETAPQTLDQIKVADLVRFIVTFGTPRPVDLPAQLAHPALPLGLRDYHVQRIAANHPDRGRRGPDGGPAVVAVR